MILATILRARFRMPQRVLAELFGVVTGTIAKAERQIRPLLDQRRHVIEPAGMQVKTLAELTAFAASTRRHSYPGNESRALIICKRKSFAIMVGAAAARDGVWREGWVLLVV